MQDMWTSGIHKSICAHHIDSESRAMNAKKVLKTVVYLTQIVSDKIFTPITEKCRRLGSRRHFSTQEGT